ncbi:MAG: ribosome rescue protein RqcH [Candidatus Kariarchaeaceae archaeon]|jgi:predicted ribosome quality control (RQC) complex YloA/Tae2 family protein
MTLTGIDVRVITHEIRTIVEKSWIVNIYEIPGKIFIFKLRQPQVGLRFLLVEPGVRYHLTSFNREMPKEPTNFAMTLRSHLRNKMINWVEQVETDRLVKLSIGPDPSYTLVLELFGEGNMILVNPKGKITSAMRYRKMRDRDIHPGRIFEDMPSQPRDLLRNGTDGLESYLTDIPRLVPALNTWLGLGPYYSRYLLKELDIRKKGSDELTPEEIDSIVELANSLKTRLENHDYDPLVYLDKEGSETAEEETVYDEQWGDDTIPFRPEDVVKIFPWKQPIADEEELEIYEPTSFWSAIDVFYSAQEKHEVLEGESEQLTTLQDKLQTQLEEQTKHKKNLEAQAVEFRNAADALYANFQPASELISTVYNAKKNNMPWDTIIEKLEIGKGKGMAAALLLDRVVPDQAKLFLNLENADQKYSVAVDFRKSLTDNANHLYTQAKRSEKKAKGAEIAILRTNDRISQADHEVASNLAKQRDKVVILKRRKNWYEKFHWAKTPNNTLIIGGFDAGSNEKLVKRYLDGDDIFLHANLQGASAVIIKNAGNVSENTKRIAAQLAVSYSSGWKAKLPMSDAFAVESDQVSLTPPSGEYLPKGSFMIYGEKEFINGVPLEMCIGVVIERHWARVIAGPVSCMEEAHFYATVVPGAEQRGKVAKQILGKFRHFADDVEAQKIEALDMGEIAWYLPGDSKITGYVDQKSKEEINDE